MNTLVNKKALRDVITGVNQFSAEFHKALAENEKGNMICSPISVSMVLSMVALGARGNTEEELRALLRLPVDDDIVKNGYRAFVDSLNNFRKVNLSVANKIFVKTGLELKDEFNSITETSFRSATENLDFDEKEKACGSINNWCENKTNGCIKEIIKPDDLGDNVMILLNAIHFKGNWLDHFDPEFTSFQDFQIDENTTKQVLTMYRNGKYNFGFLEALDADYFELPYQSIDDADALSMFIILSREINNLKQIEDNLHKIDFSTLAGGSFDEIDLFLPKFKIESSFDLTDVLMNMGMKDAFGDGADFSGISNNPKIKVSKIIQKAFIEVNEEGTEAAAITQMQIRMLCLPPRFQVDRPFFYAIVAKKEGIPLFTGKVVDPTL